MHCGGHVREPVEEAFSGDISIEWYKSFPSKGTALKALGELWNCTDVVPSLVRTEAADWLEAVGVVEDFTARELRAGCSFAQMVRRLIPALSSVPDWARES